LAIACTVNPGEEVDITDPCFVSYTSIIELCGAKAVKVPVYEKNEFKINPDDLRKAVTKNTRMIKISRGKDKVTEGAEPFDHEHSNAQLINKLRPIECLQLASCQPCKISRAIVISGV
jgi:hypothetical protein